MVNKNGSTYIHYISGIFFFQTSRDVTYQAKARGAERDEQKTKNRWRDLEPRGSRDIAYHCITLQ